MSNYRNYENPLILREMIMEQRKHIAYLLNMGASLQLIYTEFTELEKLENREKHSWEDEMTNGTL